MTAKKILIKDKDTNSLVKKRMFPEIHFDFNQDLYHKIVKKTCKLDGNYFAIENEQGEEEYIFGSKYSESRQIKKILEKINLEKDTLYFYTGFDTGLLAKLLLEKLSTTSKLIIFEPNPELFFRIYESGQLSDLINDERFYVVFGSNIERIAHTVKDIFYQYAPNLVKFCPIEKQENVPFVDNLDVLKNAVLESISKALSFIKLKFNTKEASLINVINNSMKMLRCQDWNGLIDQLHDKPLVVVGIGPSLHHELECLKQNQNKCHVLCVDNALRTLTQHGIKPDMVFTVDWQGVTSDFYSGVELSEETILITVPTVSPHVFNFWKGPVLFSPPNILAPVFKDLYQYVVRDFGGSNVGTMAAQIPTHVKSSEVILVGYDFSSPMAGYFHPGSIALLDHYPSVSRFWSIERMDYEHLQKHPQTERIKASDGEIIWTDMTMRDGAETLGDVITIYGDDIKFYNSSKDALPIRKVNHKPLGEFYEQISVPSNKTVLNISQSVVSYDDILEQLDRKEKEADKYLRLLKDIARAAEEALKVFRLHPKRFQGKLEAFAEAQKNLNRSKLGWVEVQLSQFSIALKWKMDVDRSDIVEMKDEEERRLTILQKAIENVGITESAVNELKAYFESLRKKCLSKKTDAVE